ncbi:MAG: hypothetical protein GY801_30230 [bacterium]|nr:hypothetical protein [bacterium]
MPSKSAKTHKKQGKHLNSFCRNLRTGCQLPSILEDRLDADKRLFRACIEEGVYFHTDFTVSAAHTREDIDFTLEKIQVALKKAA